MHTSHVHLYKDQVYIILGNIAARYIHAHLTCLCIWATLQVHAHLCIHSYTLQVSHSFPNQQTFKKANRSSLVSVHLHGTEPPRLNLEDDLESTADSSLGLPQSRVHNIMYSEYVRVITSMFSSP